MQIQRRKAHSRHGKQSIQRPTCTYYQPHNGVRREGTDEINEIRIERKE
jgi:hypothetical protein